MQPESSNHQPEKKRTFFRHLALERGNGNKMSDTYIIEVSSEAAGIVVRVKNGFHFFAASHRFNPLEGRIFRSAREAERVATRFLAGGLEAAVA